MFKMQKKKNQITNQNTAKPVLFKMQTKNKTKKKTDNKSNYSKTSGKQINVTKIRMC